MLDIVILAAGKGSRMYSSLPKVLHPLAGRPLLQHVLDTAQQLEPDSEPVMVVGHGAAHLQEVFANRDCRWVEQEEQLGTGHAVLQALPLLRPQARCLILYGDVPLIAVDTLRQLCADVDVNSLGLLTVTLDNPTGYGRILRNESGEVTGIVEHKDASATERSINEVNTGIMVVNVEHLQRWLPALSADNQQGEYYLTDIIAMAHQQGVAIKTTQPAAAFEVEGINNRLQQASLEREYQRRLAHQLMLQGVAIADPERFDCRGQLQAGTDVFIDINVIIEGEVILGNNTTIGANTLLKDCVIGNDCQIKPNTIIEGAQLADAVEVGPFARLRPGANLADKVRVGNFVEIKKSHIGIGSKINHLSYIGDCQMGAQVNIGAGSITCNYDGVNKHITRIDDKVFVGSNTALVAPVSVACGTTIAAGSVITQDTQENDLAVARSRQRNISNWPRPQKNP